jgi:hypothetical protein
MLGLVIAAAVMGLPIGGEALVPVPEQQVAGYFDCLLRESPGAAKRYVAFEPQTPAAMRALGKLDPVIATCMKPLGFQYMKSADPGWYRDGLLAAMQRQGAMPPKSP